VTAFEYLEQSGVPESRWANFRNWVAWYEAMRLMGVVKGEDGAIRGVALVRFVKDGQKPDPYVHDEAGEDVYVDLVVCDASSSLDNLGGRSDALCSLLTMLLRNAGPRRRLIFNRHGIRKEYDYTKFMKKVLL